MLHISSLSPLYPHTKGTQPIPVPTLNPQSLSQSPFYPTKCNPIPKLSLQKLAVLYKFQHSTFTATRYYTIENHMQTSLQCMFIPKSERVKRCIVVTNNCGWFCLPVIHHTSYRV